MDIDLSGLGFAETSNLAGTAQLLPDLDGDTAPEIAIAVPNADVQDTLEKAGTVVIVSGKTGKELKRIDGDFEGATFGTTLALCGKDELVIGAPGNDAKPGLVYIVQLRKFQNLNHPKNHEYDGEINETWDNHFSGTALATLVLAEFLRRSNQEISLVRRSRQ